MLSVQHYSNSEMGKDARVTLNPFELRAVCSSDIEVNGKPMKEVTIHFTGDEEPMILNVMVFDAQAIEDMVGAIPEF